MPAFCLVREQADKFRKGLKDGSINPGKMAQMASAERRAYLEKFVGKENAKEVNALFESKLLLKNQKAGYISWAKKVAGMTVESKRDMISRIERLQEVLDPKAEQAFLEDLAAKRLGIEVTAQEAKGLAELSKKAQDLREKAREDGTFPTEKDRLNYGAAQVALEDYFNQLKLDARSISFKEHPFKKSFEIVKESPGTLKSIVASLDNSFFGRQGIKTLYTHPVVWGRTFARSWVDIGRELKGKDAMAAIKADIYSRPNALNGKYKAGGYGLNVLSEEAFPSSVPAKIPGFKRLYKASESAYNGAALRMRADLADLLIKKAEEMGINTLDPEQAAGMGSLVSSMTGRGNIPMTPGQAKATNVLFFSIKFLKSNIDTLTAHMFDSKASPFVKREAALNLFKIVGTTATILTIAKILDPNSVDEDPRSSNFGKVKLFGHWIDITGGLAGLSTLAARTLVPTYHDGELGLWKKSSTGKYSNLIAGQYGQQDALDLIIEGLFTNKLSPMAGVVRDVWKGQNFNGEPVTPGSVVSSVGVPLTSQQWLQILKDPTSSFPLGSMMLEFLGFSNSTSPIPNKDTNLIPENKKISNKDFISTVTLYANAIGTDPETAMNRIFTGQTIRRVDNGAIIVERMSLDASQAEKRKRNAANPQVKLDHTVPLELGGSNEPTNLKVVTNAEWKSYTPVENALGKALRDKKISKSEAQRLIKEFKSYQDSSNRKEFGQKIIDKYK